MTLANGTEKMALMLKREVDAGLLPRSCIYSIFGQEQGELALRIIDSALVAKKIESVYTPSINYSM